jgi:recombination protein RecA
MAADREQKMKIIEDAIVSIEKTYGKGSIMKLGDGIVNDIEAIPTGALSLDYALGIGGIPRGRVTEIYGPESSGKTLDVNYAKKLGVDTANLLISQPDFGEQALEIADTLVRSNALDVIVIDSVAALVPRSEIEGEMGDATMAVQARLMSQALRKLTAAISKSKTSVIFINQLRSKIGIMFGNPETTTGGNALKFYASLRIDIRRIAAIKEGENVVGNRTKVKIVKSKVAPPFKQVEFDILYNEGISKVGDLIDLGVDQGIIKKSGAWFTYAEDRFQGREGFRQKLIELTDVRTKLENEVKAKLGMIKNSEDVKNDDGHDKQKQKDKKSK